MSLTDVLARHGALRESQLGRPISTPRDVLDLLVSLKGHDPFWSELGATEVDADLSQLRSALPDAPFARDLPVDRCLAHMGVDAADIPAILDDKPAADAVSDAISTAFEAGGPKEVARALESLLTHAPVHAAMQRMPARSTLARSVGLVFLVCSLAGMAFGSLTACYKGVTPEA